MKKSSVPKISGTKGGSKVGGVKTPFTDAVCKGAKKG